jgi:hypothetical protein
MTQELLKIIAVLIAFTIGISVVAIAANPSREKQQ